MNLKAIQIGSVVMMIIGLVIMITALSVLVPEVDTASHGVAGANTSLTNVSESTGLHMPLASLFESGGLVMLAFMGMIVLLAIGAFGFVKRR